MKLINQEAKLLPSGNLYEVIELAGRTCYKSEDKITEGSAATFCQKMLERGHTAMIEHAVPTFMLHREHHVYLTGRSVGNLADDLRENPFAHVTEVPGGYLVSVNARALNEMPMGISYPFLKALQTKYPILAYNEDFPYFNKVVQNHATVDYPYAKTKVELVDFNRVEDLKTGLALEEDRLTDLSLEMVMKHKHLTFRFTTDRGVSHELVRHRLASFAQESTRYCLYSKEKFGAELTFIRPSTFDSWTDAQREQYLAQLRSVESCYLSLTAGKDGLQAQQARAILPNSIKTEIVMTANLSEWNHVFNLRLFGLTGAPHPDMKALMGLAYTLAVQDPLVAQILTKEM